MPDAVQSLLWWLAEPGTMRSVDHLGVIGMIWTIEISTEDDSHEAIGLTPEDAIREALRRVNV